MICSESDTESLCVCCVADEKSCLVPGNVCTANLFPFWKIQRDKNKECFFITSHGPFHDVEGFGVLRPGRGTTWRLDAVVRRGVRLMETQRQLWFQCFGKIRWLLLN